MRQRPAMPPAVRARFEAELDAARNAADRALAWQALERAHVLSQPWPRPHVHTHWAMLRLGWAHRDRREVAGQLLRLAAAGPASFAGRFPVGNTGRARVPAMKSMPVAPELAELLAAAGVSCEVVAEPRSA